MDPITAVKPKIGDLYDRMIDGGLYRQAAQDGMSLSAWLERADPSEDYKDGLDSFSRMLKHAGIVTRGDPYRGYSATRWGEAADDPKKRALLPEWCIRQWRKAQLGYDPFAPSGQRAVMASSDSIVGGVLQPFADATAARMKQISPPIPLSEIVAFTTGITGNVYRAAFLTDDPTQARMVRVGEGGEIPRAKLALSDHTVNLYKYGRGLESTYEVLRRLPLDLVALHLARLAVQTEVDKVATALDVMVNGDGNANTAAVEYDITDLDLDASAGGLTLKAWLAFKLKLAGPYAMTHAIAQEAGALGLMLLSHESANLPLALFAGPSGFGSFAPINPGLSNTVRLGWTADAPANKIVGFDARYALEMVTEVGSEIQEVERYLSRQTQAIFISEVVGFAVSDPFAAVILDAEASIT